MKPALLITLIFLCVVAVGHLIRVVFQIEFIVAGIGIPQWPSALAVVALVALAVWLYREQGAR
jgi:hypothetical protein